jgi:hypothetical protein
MAFPEHAVTIAMNSALSHPWPENVTRALDTFADRRCTLLGIETTPVSEADRFGAKALAMLVAGRNETAANVVLKQCAEWFEHPVREGLNGHQGECDFSAIKLCRAYHLFAGGAPLAAETLASIRTFFTRKNFASIYQSENHALLFHTSRHLMAQAYTGDFFQAYEKTGEQLAAEDGAWLRRFMRYRAGHGWGEFDSVGYLGPVWECLTCLHDFSADQELKRLAGSMMDLLLADMAVDSLHGMYCGAHGRIYPPHAIDHVTEPSRILYYLYFGEIPTNGMEHHGFIIDALTSTYRPLPIVVDIALNRGTAYENRERKQLHNLADVLPVAPLTGSLRKYTYYTPRYALGCVQFQDAYPACCAHHNHHEIPVMADQRGTADYAHHQQHQWDLSFPTGTTARLFTHHPGTDGTHNYWTGDRLCGCGHFFQHKQALIALYDIPASQPLQFIHAYLPRDAFDEVIEENGWIFARAGDAFAGLWLSSAYRWTTEGEWADREIISAGLKHAVICEAGTTDNYVDFTAFRHAIAGTPVHFDRESMTLDYRSSQTGPLRIDSRGGRYWNERPVDLDYGSYDSPYLYSAWGSGVIEMKIGSTRHILDFNSTASPAQ